MAQPRPSLTLILDIDERLDNEELRREVDRCYSHVGPTLVHPHPTADGEPENIMHFLVKLGTRNYLHATDAGADELWDGVMQRWLYNELHKVSNNMKIFNRRQRDMGGTPLMFDWVEVDLQNNELTALLHCDTASGLSPEVSEQLSVMRTAYNNGALGCQVQRVFMPSRASYTQQQTVGQAEKKQRDLEEATVRAADIKAEQVAREKAEAQAEKAFLASPALCSTNENTPVATDPAADDPFLLDEPDFAVSYQLWSIEQADGSMHTYDSKTGVLLD